MSTITFNGKQYAQIPNHSRYYISECGELIWSAFNKTRVVNGRLDRFGYLKVNMSTDLLIRKTYRIHSLMKVVYMGGDTNGNYRMHVNHKDGNKLNNHLSNLELVSMEENQRHHQILNNPLGIGVTMIKRTGKYEARMQLNRKRIYIGHYKTAQQAADAYMDRFIALGLSDKYVEATEAYKRAQERAKGMGL